ncbi:Protein-S-isoprenylcysteine O-methyltransferase [Trichoderma ghanense]|uniref:Protein-S-isoprenylcysteine O-methyltransferase n=1 Tax=Trichoderma ghanense TaxID=65468 RepID=A0ABY2GU96_9HYPO
MATSFTPQPTHHSSPPINITLNNNTTDPTLSNPSNPLKPFYPGQPKSLSGIALRAFLLGTTFATSLLSTIAVLLLTNSPIWRVPFFLLALSLFHFLEFWTTAERNTAVASIDSFLLTANWPSYAIAHSAAFIECLLVSVFFPDRRWAPLGSGNVLLFVGLALVVVGQVVRSLAMLHAGASFNHHIQTKKAQTHLLVTTGIYGWLRHPSYFGFFYWGLGTQLVLGNAFCFVAYAAVLYTFFRERIEIEEHKLVEFFGEDYVNYRKRVGTLIPFIR